MDKKSFTVKIIFGALSVMAMLFGSFAGSTSSFSDRVFCGETVARTARNTDYGKTPISFSVAPEKPKTTFEDIRSFALRELPYFELYRTHYDGFVCVDPAVYGNEPNELFLGETSIPLVGLGLRTSGTLKPKNGLFRMESAPVYTYYDYDTVLKVVKTAAGFSIVISDALANRIIGFEPEGIEEKKEKYWDLIGRKIDTEVSFEGVRSAISFTIYNIFSAEEEHGAMLRWEYGDGVAFSYSFGNDIRYDGVSLDVFVGGSSYGTRSFLDLFAQKIPIDRFECRAYSGQKMLLDNNQKLTELIYSSFLTPQPEKGLFYVFFSLYLVVTLAQILFGLWFSKTLAARGWVLLLIVGAFYTALTFFSFASVFVGPAVLHIKNEYSMIMAFVPAIVCGAIWPISALIKGAGK